MEGERWSLWEVEEFAVGYRMVEVLIMSLLLFYEGSLLGVGGIPYSEPALLYPIPIILLDFGG